jgi:stage V sporulation protein AD
VTYLLKGKQSWQFDNKPAIIASSSVVGPFEGKGKLADEFDIIYDELWMKEDSFEKAHKLLIEDAIEINFKKSGKTQADIQFLIAGDLINLLTPTNFAARTHQIPFMGIYNACATSMEGLALASFLINYGGAKYVITGAASHNAAAERQFRYPTEYGGQKPPTSQWTVTGAGFGLIAASNPQMINQPVVASATIGKVIDMGLTDPMNMGGAMAPAAADTIFNHFQDLGLAHDYYDAIFTGDLGEIGSEIAFELLSQRGFTITREKFQDCGLMIYGDDQEVESGGSGAGCSAVVFYSHILNELTRGVYKRVLICATGALLSPLSFQQGESIPCIAHVVGIEISGGQA